MTITADKFISVKKSCVHLECTEQQLNGLLNNEPRAIRHRGIGMTRTLSEYDVLEWSRRPGSLAELFKRVIAVEMPIIINTTAPDARTLPYKQGVKTTSPPERKADPMSSRTEPKLMKNGKKSKQTAPPMLMYKKQKHWSMGYVEHKTGRPQVTVTNWMDKSTFKIEKLADPKRAGSPKRQYISQEALEYIIKKAKTAPRQNTEKSKASTAHTSKERMTISAAARLFQEKDARVRHLANIGKLKTYGPKKLVKPDEVRVALAKSGAKKKGTTLRLDRALKAVDQIDQNRKNLVDMDKALTSTKKITMAAAARLFNETPNKIHYLIRSKKLPSYKPNNMVKPIEVKNALNGSVGVPRPHGLADPSNGKKPGGKKVRIHKIVTGTAHDLGIITKAYDTEDPDIIKRVLEFILTNPAAEHKQILDTNLNMGDVSLIVAVLDLLEG